MLPTLNDARIGYKSKQELILAQNIPLTSILLISGYFVKIAHSGFKIQHDVDLLASLAALLAAYLVYKNYNNNFNAQRYSELLRSENPVLLFSNQKALRDSFKHTALNVLLLFTCIGYVITQETRRFVGKSANTPMEIILALAAVVPVVSLMRFANENFGAEVHVSENALRQRR